MLRINPTFDQEQFDLIEKYRQESDCKTRAGTVKQLVLFGLEIQNIIGKLPGLDRYKADHKIDDDQTAIKHLLQFALRRNGYGEIAYYFLIDTQYLIIDMSLPLLHRLNYYKDDLISQPVSRIMTPESWDKLVEHYNYIANLPVLFLSKTNQVLEGQITLVKTEEGGLGLIKLL